MSISQAMLPSGLLGRPFGWIMERMNRPVYHDVLAILDVKPDASLLEIGFGTGGFLEQYCKTFHPQRITGMDPSPLMHSQTEKRLQDYSTVSRQLFLGDDRALCQINGHFNHIVALHSYQFWQNPEASLRQVFHLLTPDGMLVLALRRHQNPPPDWLANPVSRGPRETDDTLDLLRWVGFASAEITQQDRHSVIITARL